MSSATAVTALQAVIGISSFFGVVGLLAYLYTFLQLNTAESSISRVIEGDSMLSAHQVVKILGQFKDDNARLKALEALTSYSKGKTKVLYEKVKSEVDVAKISRLSAEQYRRKSLFTGLFFLALAAAAAIFYKTSDPQPPATGKPSQDQVSPSAAASSPSSSSEVILHTAAKVASKESTLTRIGSNDATFTVPARKTARAKGSDSAPNDPRSQSQPLADPIPQPPRRSAIYQTGDGTSPISGTGTIYTDLDGKSMVFNSPIPPKIGEKTIHVSTVIALTQNTTRVVCPPYISLAALAQKHRRLWKMQVSLPPPLACGSQVRCERQDRENGQICVAVTIDGRTPIPVNEDSESQGGAIETDVIQIEDSMISK